LARVREGRVFHPLGVTFSGRLDIWETESLAGRALGGSWPIRIRASKGAGTPGNWPDFHGLALRLDHPVGPIDLLFTTVSRRLPHLLAPSIGWCSQPYTTFLPYVTQTGRVVLRLDPNESTRAPKAGLGSIASAVSEWPLTFAVMESHGLSWRTVGALSIENIDTEALTFDPVLNQHPWLRHAPLVAGLRARAYAGSRRGRTAQRNASNGR